MDSEKVCGNLFGAGQLPGQEAGSSAVKPAAKRAENSRTQSEIGELAFAANPRRGLPVSSSR